MHDDLTPASPSSDMSSDMSSDTALATSSRTHPAQHVLISAMGLHPDPVALSIAHHDPDVVIFLASQQSQSLISTLDLAGRRQHCLLIDDISDWQETYDKAQQALELAFSYGTADSRPKLTIEPTFGSKIMSAGLVLACAGYGATWSYVYGSHLDYLEERNNVDGAVSSQGRVISFADPIATRLHEHWQDWADAWNAARYSECERILKRILSHPLPVELRTLYGELRYVVIGLEQWQHGHYEDALDTLEVYVPSTLQACDHWRETHLQPLPELLIHLEYEHLPRLRAIVDSQRAPSTLLPDVLATMHRFAHSERYDLAALSVRQLLLLVRNDAQHLTIWLEPSLRQLEGQLERLENSFIRHGIGTAQQTLFDDIEKHTLKCCQQLGIEPATALPTWTSSDIL